MSEYPRIPDLEDRGDVATVLAAERAARDRIKAAREDARATLERARTEARRVEQRAIEATHHIRESARAHGQRRIEALRAGAERRLQGIEDDAPAHDADAVAETLARSCARELLGLPVEDSES